MKQLLVVTILIFGVSLLNAQDKTAKEYKIEAADAYKAKDYQTGLTSFEQSIKLYEADGKTDTTLYYNVAVCAYKVKDYEKALSYFDQAIALQYKSCKSYLYKANALKKLENYEDMEAVCNMGGSKCPKYKNKYDEILFNYYLKTGLGIFNNAAKMQSDAAPFAQTDQDKYNAEMENVKDEFNRSLPLLEKAHDIKPDDENCNKALRQAYDILDMKAKAAGL